jgi:hypothetical protein
MMRKQDKMKRLCAASLTYFRLKADLAAIELELADNAPLLQTTEGNFLKKIWKKATTGIHNELRKKTTETLEKERAVVETELAKFESQHTEKTLLYSNNPEALKAFINKSLFRKDKDGLKRLRFAISLILDDRYSYQRPILSLQPLSDILFDSVIYACDKLCICHFCLRLICNLNCARKIARARFGKRCSSVAKN